MARVDGTGGRVETLKALQEVLEDLKNVIVNIVHWFIDDGFVHRKQGNYSLRRPPKLIIPQAVIRH